MTFSPNSFASTHIKGYKISRDSVYRWQHNFKGGITLQQEMFAYVDVGKGPPLRHHLTWMSIANVYKAKRGNRFIAEVNGYRKLFPFQTLREAMRMAKFLHQTKSKS